MYSVRMGFDEALGRIEVLLGNGHDAEALVTNAADISPALLMSQ
ncbi:hypothetical protein ACVJBD_000396 [Rhizobium mongolense]